MSNYRNILYQARPIPSRPRMPRQNRAKIFAPYQALKDSWSCGIKGGMAAEVIGNLYDTPELLEAAA